ncbi:hypothetical protein IAG25_33095 [Caballeronia sp. EK]|uniref:hypothetical protein n=1 Tax=Caballeronia sp. EK TaxID=2767469 RepID=UPI001656062B|nr:hypothetical protein [Caballeronia sp. EK]MBC8641664.1 hypothetical protein [Caballeronia sp. EK]
MRLLFGRENKIVKRKLNMRRFQRSQTSRFARINALTRHPLTLLVIGFLLTGVVGSGISYIKQSSDEAAAHRAGIAEHFRASLDLYEANLSSWEVRASNIDDVISNGLSSEQIEKAMDEYIKAYITIYASTEQLSRALSQYGRPINDRAKERTVNFLVISFTGMVRFNSSVAETNGCLRSMYLIFKTHSKKNNGPCQSPYASDVTAVIHTGNDTIRSEYVEWNHTKIQDLIHRTRECGKEIIRALRPSESFNSTTFESADDSAFNAINEVCSALGFSSKIHTDTQMDITVPRGQVLPREVLESTEPH